MKKFSFVVRLPVAGSYTGSDLAFPFLRLTRPPHQKLSGSLIWRVPEDMLLVPVVE